MKTALHVIALVLAASATVRAATSAELLDSLRSAVVAEIQAARKTTKDNAPSENLQTLTGALQQLQSPSSDGNESGNTLRRTLAALQTTSGSEKIAQLAKAAGDQLDKETQARMEVIREKLDAIGKRCSEQLLTAKTAQELDAPLKELRDSIHDSMASRLNNRTEEVVELQSALATLASRLEIRQNFLFKLGSGDKDGALNLLRANRPLTNAERVPWISRAVALQAFENDRKALVGSAAELAERAKALGVKVLVASTAKELDPFIDELTALQAAALAYEGDGEKNIGAIIRGTLEFTRQWQEFLAARAAGNLEKARSIVGTMTNVIWDYKAVPRSEVLARIYGDDAITPAWKKAADAGGVLLSPDQVLAKIKTLDDLDRLLPEFQASIATDRNTWTTMSTELLAVARAYRNLRVGNSAQVNLNLTGSENREPLATLRGQLAIFALPRILAVAETDQPLAGETAVTYLRRMIAAARERQDWQFASRILAVMQAAQASDLLLQSGDSTALASYLAALNYEKAREFALAVNCFQNALRTGSELIPAAAIGERLAAIKRDHAAEYADGLQLTLTSPEPPTGPFGRPFPDTRRSVVPPGVRASSPFPGFFDDSPKEPSIPVPAKSEAATVTPKPAAPEPEPGKK